ncbi:hypothetical protein GGP41_000760, partial [Bipolaris sorokiniana]
NIGLNAWQTTHGRNRVSNANAHKGLLFVIWTPEPSTGAYSKTSEDQASSSSFSCAHSGCEAMYAKNNLEDDGRV